MRFATRSASSRILGTGNSMGGMAGTRVVDFGAEVYGETWLGEIPINGKMYSRRLVVADAVFAVIGETTEVTRGMDAWHCEPGTSVPLGDGRMAVLYSGDRKCTSATWWNTGNPRNLREICVMPVTLPQARSRGQITPALWRWLAGRHSVARAGPVAGDLLSAWFACDPSALMADMAAFLHQGRDPYGRMPDAVMPDATTILYLVAEDGDRFVKLGKCTAGRTSPPARRVAMYAPGNPRALRVVAKIASSGVV